MTPQEFDNLVSGLPGGEGMPCRRVPDPRALAEFRALQRDLDEERCRLDAYLNAIDRAESFTWLLILAALLLMSAVAYR